MKDLAHMLKTRMSEMAARLERFQLRAEKRRQLVRDVMLETDVKKLQMPDFTASLRNGQPHVVVIDEKPYPANLLGTCGRICANANCSMR